MSIRHSLLALLLDGDAYGNLLRTSFEERTGGTWPLNIGQVYQTLDRLARDGLVGVVENPREDLPVQARTLYALTDAGREEVLRWLGEPVVRTSAPRDELSIKLAIAHRIAEIDLLDVIDVQRAATMRTLQGLTMLRRRNASADPASSTEPWTLVLDRIIFDTEAELRWLDHCESTLFARAGAK